MRYLAVALGMIIGLVVTTGVSFETGAAADSSPMARYVGFGHNPGIELTIFERDENQRQVLVERCMGALGLPYVPRRPDSNTFAPPSESKMYYGLTDGITLSGDVAITVELDPNTAYALSLPATEAASYLVALYGEEWQSQDQPTSAYEQSCVGRAYTSVPGLAASAAPLRARYRDAIETALAASEPYQQALDRWRECLRRDGVSAETPADLMSSIDRAISAAQEDDGHLDKTEIAEIASFEARLYSADMDCRDGLMSAHRASIVEAEGDFVAAHMEALEPFLLDQWYE